VRGDLPIRDANRLLDLDLPQGEGWSTLAGFAIALAGRIPPRGARLRSGEISIEVVDATSHAVLAVRVRRGAVSPPHGQPDARAAAD